MSNPERIEAIVRGEETTPELQPTQIETRTRGQEANKERFDSLMRGDTATAAAPEQKLSILDTQAVAKQAVPSQAELVQQTKETIGRIEQIKHVLEGNDVHLKQSVQQILHGKLSHIDESLQIVLSKAGLEAGGAAHVADATTGRPNPITRFMGLLTHGQWQLENLGKELATMAATDKELTPVNMLAIQVKVGQIQQELELFSNLLNKSLESIKTVMNIQV